MAVPLDTMGGGLKSEDASLPRPSPRPIEDKEAIPRASWVNRSSGLRPPGGVGKTPPLFQVAERTLIFSVAQLPGYFRVYLK